MLIFVATIAWTGRDYGPMHEAETIAINETTNKDQQDADRVPKEKQLMRHAIIPLFTLLALIAAGTIALHEELAPFLVDDQTSNKLVETIDHPLNQETKNDPAGEQEDSDNFLGLKETSHILLIASFLASIMAVISTLTTRTLSLQQSMDAWIDGVKSMVPACVILVMAWMIGAVCDDNHLNTAGFLISTIGDSVNPAWLPGIAFLMAAGVSFATGSSWATMTLLIPLFTSLSWNLAGVGTGGVHDPVLLGTVGSVLAGAIFGDHCSPISDTDCPFFGGFQMRSLETCLHTIPLCTDCRRNLAVSGLLTNRVWSECLDLLDNSSGHFDRRGSLFRATSGSSTKTAYAERTQKSGCSDRSVGITFPFYGIPRDQKETEPIPFDPYDRLKCFLLITDKKRYPNLFPHSA